LDVFLSIFKTHSTQNNRFDQLSLYLRSVNQKPKIMEKFESFFNAEGLELERVVEELTETTTVFSKKTTVGKSKSAPKRSPEEPELEPEDMDVVEVTTEKSETHTGVKKATAVKAKPAPKS
jgi:hypothetical protein